MHQGALPLINVFHVACYVVFSSLVERRYKQMLEEEQKSLARNKKLLEDIDRLEEQMRYFSHECKQDEGKLNEAKVVFHIHKLANSI